MKINNFGTVRILDSQSNVWSTIREIANSNLQEDAFYVCDLGDVVRKHEIWKSSLPRVEPYYAVKCNDSIEIIKVLAALGTGFDCASKAEINLVLSVGVDPSRIIFANPAKPASHIRHAVATNVDDMTFDNESELYKIKSLYPNAKLVIRIRCEAENAQCPLGMKFGCDPIEEAPMLLRTARRLGINVIGVSFHVGSGCRDPPVFKRAIAAARDVFDFAASLGYNFKLLDIGGGYPGDFGTSIEKIAAVVNKALDDYFPDPSVRVIAEPGRFFVSSAYTLTCSIHSIRKVTLRDAHNETSSDHFMYYINDGVYGSFNCILYDHQRVVAQTLKDYHDCKAHPSSVWGPTCDGLDQVIKEIMLPELNLGDWLVFENMGAYTVPVASPFNGFPVPKVHLVINKNIWLYLKELLSFDEELPMLEEITTDIEFELTMQKEGKWTPCKSDSMLRDHIGNYVDIGLVD